MSQADFIEFWREFRRRHWNTQQALADAVGTSRSNVAQWESSRVIPLAVLTKLLSSTEIPRENRDALRDKWADANPGSAAPMVTDPLAASELVRRLLDGVPSEEVIERALHEARMRMLDGRAYESFMLASAAYTKSLAVPITYSRIQAALALGEVQMTLGDFASAASSARRAAAWAGEEEPERRVLALVNLSNSLRHMGPNFIPDAQEALKSAGSIVKQIAARGDLDWRLKTHAASISRDKVLMRSMVKLRWGLDMPMVSSHVKRLKAINAESDETGWVLSAEVLARSAAIHGSVDEAEQWLSRLFERNIAPASIDATKRSLSQILFLGKIGRVDDAHSLAENAMKVATEAGYLHYREMIEQAITF